MKTLPASKLAETLELEPMETALFDYIIESFDNGQATQTYNLYMQIEEHNKYQFVYYTDRIDILRYLLLKF